MFFLFVVYLFVITGDQKDKEIHFSERSVCRPFLLGICINDQFINTVS